jgi:O-acetyl-ADP-ribose deacetylase (regulator of RNase III)
MKFQKVFLVDRNKALVEAWKETFKPFPEVISIQGDFFSQSADVMVSPANSFGIMDGGLDLAIRNQLGDRVESLVQKQIIEESHGELPVGLAVIVPTSHQQWPFLVCAPTMRVPEDVSKTLNSYLSFRATLLAIRKYNDSSNGQKINTLVCPGLATGIGKMPARKCAAQMRLAYIQALGSPELPTFENIHLLHEKMMTVS